ncbi:ferritin-like domain-containing protein [Hymenobacter sp. GOD-10R]|uniref:YciE/YciF ferroxidase family protein n=1 Tax=Hymenobacter sp. GOD-10R TaxID=3093922 RepID=UPI002D76DE7C|nr:DUF892 family protein [Hymenobacter sp. GOD-10R]WRQ29208.1 DUF892 family protein [Hymenobacter sp. GOD-10R]
MEALKELKALLAHEVQMMHSAENILLAGLPLIIEKASNEELKAVLDMHWKETGMQVKRLEKAAEYLHISASGNQNPGMKGLLTESEKLTQQEGAEPLVDTALIVGMQKIEHYEIASYGTAAYLADELGLTEVADLLRETLLEERNTSSILGQIAQKNIIRQAAKV